MFCRGCDAVGVAVVGEGVLIEIDENETLDVLWYLNPTVEDWKAIIEQLYAQMLELDDYDD